MQVAFLRKHLIRIPGESPQVRIATIAIPGDGLQAAVLGPDPILDGYTGRFDSVRRTGGHINMVTRYGVKIIDARTMKANACLSRHLHEDAVLLADQIERLSAIIAAQANLRI